ncbi:MAG: AraC family transcriptional regulator [Sphingobacteriales bacterium JAD_PAG50586_3]|nr:MAG: AraC family transcriptional regulator [Sphingobacteriales bacterium JAD_PAG50586_3]
MLVKTGNQLLKDFAKKLSAGKPVVLSANNLPLDAAMHQCIYTITHYNEDPALQQMYLYTRVVDLLRLQQQSYIKATAAKPAHVKTEYDKERIVYARDYLLTHMDAPPTLPQLAAIAGINEFKLKRGFRELFNHSVFGYLTDVRLEMARTALRQKQKTVTQIAFELGYASLQHFSMAFKKSMLFLPVNSSNSIQNPLLNICFANPMSGTDSDRLSVLKRGPAEKVSGQNRRCLSPEASGRVLPILANALVAGR